MKLIVGLGNPGILYAHSRHNIGFLVIKALSRQYKITLKKDKGALALSGRGRIGKDAVVLAMPLTFMNRSGDALSVLVEKYRIDMDDLLVVCDDLDLALGRLRLRERGSSGGHRGLRSIIESVGSEGFARLRVGIGRPVRASASDYVLSPFSGREKAQVKNTIEDACACCREWVTEGINKTMNIFNKESRNDE